MSNTIEEFVIKFITDAKEAKKGASDLDKFLDDFGKKRHNKDLKAHEDFLKAKKKLDDKYLGSLPANPSPTKPSSPSSPVKPKLTEEQLVEKAISARQDKELKRELALAKVHKNTAAAKKASEASQRKEIGKTRKHILDSYGKESKEIKSMRDYYKSLESQADANKAAVDKVTKALEKQAAMIRRSAGYKLYRKHGQEGGINSQIADLVSKRDLEGLTSLRYKMSDARENMAKYSREVRKATVVQKGFADSTRNMVRSFASVYAVVEGTRAIKNIGVDFQGMEASMIAASGTASAAAHDMSFINGIVNEMGLNLQDTTDAFVKFKFAAKGKISQGEQEDLFKSLSMFGTALKVDSEAMKRSQKALIQMMSKGKIMAEELSYCFITGFWLFSMETLMVKFL